MFTPPVLGFVGSSGSGKTTLLERLIATLSERGVRLAVVKHAKAGADIDPLPAPDSHRTPSAGAVHALVASGERWALMTEHPERSKEPPLEAMLQRLDRDAIDAVLVEGFRHERYAKIEVYRPSHGRPPQCWPDDRDVIAVASDAAVATGSLPRLDLNDLEAMTQFVARCLGLRQCAKPHVA